MAIFRLDNSDKNSGLAFFTQKRVGINKSYFKLHKFRPMKMSTPHDIPTHQLDNLEQYITRVGRFLRKSSFDELPQINDRDELEITIKAKLDGGYVEKLSFGFD